LIALREKDTLTRRIFDFSIHDADVIGVIGTCRSTLELQGVDPCVDTIQNEAIDNDILRRTVESNRTV